MNAKNSCNNKYKGKIFTIPNILSFIRIGMIFPLLYFYCVEKSYTAAGFVLIASGITDVADGFIARRFNMISDFGKIIDPIADKLTQAAMLLCLTFRFPLMLIPLAVLAVKELFMGITGALIIRKKGIVLGAEWHGKLATVLLYAAMMLHIFWFSIPSFYSVLSISISTAVIILSFILYAVRNMKYLKSQLQ